MRDHSQQTWLALALCGLIAALVTYAQGFPIGVTAVCLFLIPIVWMLIYAFGGEQPRLLVFYNRLGSYRSLILIYGFVALAAAREYQHEPAEVYGNPDSNYAQALETLYQGRPETEYSLGRDAEMELSTGSLDLERIHRQFSVVVGHYEQAISQGVKSNEDLLYNYALALMKMQTDSSKIDAAIASWKHNFPNSKRRDLDERRQKIADQLENMKRYEETHPLRSR